MSNPEVIKCPICGDRMSRMEIDNEDTPLSTLSFVLPDGNRRFARTIVYRCQRCNNLQSFLAGKAEV